MKIKLDTDEKNQRSVFRAFVEEEIAPHADQYDQEERIPAGMVTELARRGYLGATLPEAYGGLNMDMITFGLLNEELGRGCSSVRSLVMLQNMIAQAILRWGSDGQKELWLKRMASGEVIAAFALTEPKVGSDAKNIQTTATRSDDSFIINGQKMWISLGQIADLFLVFAQSEGQLSAFLLESGTPGLTVAPISGMLGLRASMLAELDLRDCRVPEDNLVGNLGFGLVPVAVDALNLGRYCIAWGCVGIAQACLEACIRYTTARKQFGVYLNEHQLIQQMIADMLVHTEATRLLCYRAGQSLDKGDPDFIMEVLLAKYLASTMATRVANDAVQIHGALGCSSQHPVQRYLRDARIMEIIEGTTQIHQIKIAEYGHRKYAAV
jgi:alkylation response protein AidB-like acyl-CoA dehydrogenase